jgi:uncharacterized protein (UPF0335 family)
MSGVGHNSVAAAELASFVERIENLIQERKAANSDISEVLAEAKASGFDTKTIRAVVRLRAMSKTAREEQQALLDAYLSALGLA